jgi:hypothetical protein
VVGSCREVAVEPPIAGFVRAVIACHACGWVDVLDLQQDVCSPEWLRRVWTRCAACDARGLDVTLVWEGGPSSEAEKRDTAVR